MNDPGGGGGDAPTAGHTDVPSSRGSVGGGRTGGASL